MRDWIGGAALTPPAWMRSISTCCTQASTVCTRSVGAGAYVPACMLTGLRGAVPPSDRGCAYTDAARPLAAACALTRTVRFDGAFAAWCPDIVSSI